jgi:catechol 2,3-dioxygenase-like lactoylglutathione lyase family enzyme
MARYEYRIETVSLRRRSVHEALTEVLNRWGADGWRVASLGVDPRINFNESEVSILLEREVTSQAGAWLYRVIVPADSLATSVAFWAAVLESPGELVSNGRHYFSCGGTILAIVDPKADGDSYTPRPLPDYIYLSVPDLDAAFERVKAAGPSRSDAEGEKPGIAKRAWGERSFYFHDPFGNPVCFVEAGTEFLGGARF